MRPLSAIVAASVVSIDGGRVAWSEVAFADPSSPKGASDIQVGAELLAIHEITLDEAVIAPGSKVNVTARAVQGGNVFLDVALADGHVVKAVPLPQIQKSFRVVP
jgi:hypothetical protein